MLDEESSLQHEHGTSIVLIHRLWFCQARLKRLQQMPELIAHARNGGLFNLDPLIELHQNEDEEIVINNGHHRVTAAWLAGRKILYREEFIILYKDAYRPRFGTIDVFLARLPAGVLEWLRQGESTPQAPNEGLVLIVILIGYRASSTCRSCIYLSACLLFPLA
ncbi:MAG TPA: hypothetical protein VFB12_11245 [Ktedonobacteraceae bacterium]|nr:hypothetical protein [Ktedonobacteraceae bacterium]